MGASNAIRVLTEALIAADPFETVGNPLIVRPLADDSGKLQIGNSDASFDFQIILGSASNYALFNRGGQKLELVGVAFETDGTVTAQTVNTTDLNVTGNTTGIAGSIETDPFVANGIHSNTFVNATSGTFSGLITAANLTATSNVNGGAVNVTGNLDAQTISVTPSADDTGTVTIGTNTKAIDFKVFVNSDSKFVLIDRGAQKITIANTPLESDSSINSASFKATGNINVNNVLATTNVNGASITATGNVSGNNLLATTNVNGAAFKATGNVTANNVLATTNVNGAAFKATGNVTANNVLATTNVNGAASNISGAATVGSLVTDAVISQVATIDSTDVTDQGTYHDFSAAKGTMYWVDVADIITDLDDQNTRVNFPGSPSIGDRFGFGVKAETTATGSFAQAPGYYIEPANGTSIRGASYTAGSGNKWSLWQSGEYLKFTYDGSTWQIDDDGRIPFGCNYVLSAAQTESSNVNWEDVVFDTKVFDTGNVYNTSSYSCQVKRAGNYIASACAESNIVLSDGDFYNGKLSPAPAGANYVAHAVTIGSVQSFRAITLPTVYVALSSADNYKFQIRSNVANAGCWDSFSFISQQEVLS